MADFNENLSLSGNKWQISSYDENLCARMVETYQIPHHVAQIMCAHGITYEEAENFINPKIQKLMPDPYVLKDMKKAAERIASAIEKKEQIAIIGDYDVDGATSTAELTLFLRQVGIEPLIHIPSREEGYGPSDIAFAEFNESKATLVITIDCGTTAFDVLNRASSSFDIIIIDHHEAEARLPEVFAVINPKRLDEENPYKYLEYMSAVGVGFMTLVAVNRILRQHGFYQDRNEPDLMKMLDLVSLGTVCDVVPLLGLNRAYVKQGLKVMASQNNIGLKNLMEILELKEAPTAYHLGFVLGPRINACGRVGDASLGSKLLCSENEVEARRLAEKFNQFNIERKEIENYVLLQAIEQVESKISDYPLAFAYGEGWHQGVIGIVAGKLKERYNVPAFVMSVEPDEVKGSARSVDGVDLGALIIAAKEKGIIIGGGGHMMAAGFSLIKEKIPEFEEFVGEYIQNKLGKEKIAPILNIDSVVHLTAITEDFAEGLKLLEPYGTDNPEPLIMLQNVMIVRPQTVGAGHVKCFMTTALGGRLPAISFRCVDNEIGHTILEQRGEIYDVAGTVKIDNWQNRKNIQFVIKDIKRKS